MKYQKRLPLLAVLLAVPLLMAPAAQIPEKLTAGAAQWNQDTQSVEIPLAVHPRFVRWDGYVVGVYVMIFDLTDPDSAPVAEIFEWEPIVLTGAITKDRNGLVEIEPAFVPWGRNRGTYSGPAGVCVMAQVFDREGRPVKNADAESCSVVEIR